MTTLADWEVARRSAAIARLPHNPNTKQISHVPFRTFTCTEEYPLVTFFTLRTTFDMVSSIEARAQKAEYRNRSRKGGTAQMDWGIVGVRAMPSSYSPLAASVVWDSGPK